MGACLAHLWTTAPHGPDSFFEPHPLLDAHGAKIGICVCDCPTGCSDEGLAPKESRSAAASAEHPHQQHGQWCEGRNRQQSGGEEHLHD
jgi:hypothetical protein